MFLKKVNILWLGLFCYWLPFRTSALTITQDCWTAVRLAEEDSGQYPYTSCGFDEGAEAVKQWGQLATEQGYKRALYELCLRYGQYPKGQALCQQAVNLGEVAALAPIGMKALDEGRIAVAESAFKKLMNTFTPETDTFVSEKIGIYALKTQNEPVAQSYLTAAANHRSALANRVLAVREIQRQKEAPKPDWEQAYTYLWRAILLDCPKAEEDLGLLELARQKTISFDKALTIMQQARFSCQGDVMDFDVQTCDCPVVLDDIKRLQRFPFQVKALTPHESADIQDSFGQKRHIKLGDNLLQGKITDITENAVGYTSLGKTLMVPLYQENPCFDYCIHHPQQKGQIFQTEQDEIRPYHLKFSRKECEDIAYYAPRLVDVNLPFVGKTECVKYLTR